GYQSNHSTIANVPILANATLSLPIPHTDIVPYIGGGAGGAVSVFDGHTFNDGTDFVQGEESDTVFAYQAFAGVRFTLGPNVSVGVGYKYFATADPTFSYPPSPNLNVRFSGIQSHSVLFTLQVNF
ncbi:MAG TPA: outer membrane beta-barrel protein, partial [Candidatus Acidoferrum sp.]|nr:outer membrane beta-barrel protein [Candidatus Acidoferrum sp.]